MHVHTHGLADGTTSFLGSFLARLSTARMHDMHGICSCLNACNCLAALHPSPGAVEYPLALALASLHALHLLFYFFPAGFRAVRWGPQRPLGFLAGACRQPLLAAMPWSSSPPGWRLPPGPLAQRARVFLNRVARLKPA